MTYNACRYCGGYAPTMVFVPRADVTSSCTELVAYCADHAPRERLAAVAGPKAATEGPTGPSVDSKAPPGPHRG